MSEPNLAKAQALVDSGLALSIAIVLVASFTPSYLPRLTHHVLLARVVLAAGTLIDIVLLTVYCTTSQCLCHSESCANHVTKVTIVLTASYLQSYLPYPTCYRPRRRRRAHRHPPHSCHAHCVVLITSCSLRRAHCIMLNALCRICQLSFASARSVVVAYIDVH